VICIRVVVVLEGGYNLLNVASGCAAITRVLLQPAAEKSIYSTGARSISEHDPDVHIGAMAAIREACIHHQQAWPFLAA
jgi:acetoin utilization deacetylase AcuC-like enzyme